MLESTPERVRSAALIANEIFSVHIEEDALRLHGRRWRDWLPEFHKVPMIPLESKTLMEEPQRAAALVSEVDAILGRLPIRYRQFMEERFGWETGQITPKRIVSQQHGICFQTADWIFKTSISRLKIYAEDANLIHFYTVQIGQVTIQL